MLQLTVLLGKLVSFLIRILHLGAGATWPGEVAIRLNPHILSQLIGHLKNGVIIVAGTNGKTTTALMIKTILDAHGERVVHNASGANLLNGIVSACIQSANWSGKIDADYGVFEVDENALPGVISNFQFPISNGKQKVIIVLLNLFRDQLDRYGEVDVIAEKWQRALFELDTGNQTIKLYQLIANADDPLVAHLASSASRPGLEASAIYYGLDDPSQFQKKMEHATDSTFCPHCGARLTYQGIYYSHIGDWRCPKCKNKRPSLDISTWYYPLPGLYNRYNTLAAVAVSQALDIKQETINTALAGFMPAFGRQEEFVINGRTVKIFLSKNPVGFNQSLRTVLGLGAKNLLLVLNDRIPDGRDVSWIWDVDFEMIPNHVSVRASGDRVYDLALRLKYAGIKAQIHGSLKEVLSQTEKKESLYVLPTYSAMLEVRKILKGRKIL